MSGELNLSDFKTYGKAHRIFVQSLLSAGGMLTSNEFSKLFNLSLQRSNIALPSKRHNSEAMKAFLKETNRKLEEKCDLKIQKGRDEHFNGAPKLVLISTIDRSNALAHLTPHELEYLMILVDHVLRQRQKSLSHNAALNKCSQVSSKKMNLSEAEIVIQKLKRQKWLTGIEDSKLSISLKFVLEMESYLKETYEEFLDNCKKCNKIIFRRARQCPKCASNHHPHCYEDIKGAKGCSKCKAILPEEPDFLELAPPKPPRINQRKRRQSGTEKELTSDESN